MFRRRPGDPDRMPDSIAAPRAAPNPEVPKRYSSVTAGAERSPRAAPTDAHTRVESVRTRCCGDTVPTRPRARPTTGCTCPRRQRYEDREARLDAGLEFRGSSSPPQRRTTPRSPNSDTTRSRPCPQRCARQIASAPGRSARPGPTTAPPEQVREPRTTLRRRARSVSPPEPWARRRSRRFPRPVPAPRPSADRTGQPCSQRRPHDRKLEQWARPSTSRTASTTT